MISTMASLASLFELRARIGRSENHASDVMFIRAENDAQVSAASWRLRRHHVCERHTNRKTDISTRFGIATTPAS